MPCDTLSRKSVNAIYVSLYDASVMAVGGIGIFIAGAFVWTFFEYVLHRFAFHEMRGKGIGSREHLNHHVKADWNFDPIITLAWFGVVLFGVGWATLGAQWLAMPLAVSLGAGWTFGYFFYEWHHRAAHVRAPRNQWERWLRKHHFHHHFGHPLDNEGVTIDLWDRVFGTRVSPEVVRVPRRMAMRWLLDDNGQVKPQFVADYELVGTESTTSERQLKLDRARAFANETPIA